MTLPEKLETWQNSFGEWVITTKQREIGVCRGLAKEDAVEICRRCNCHKQLVEALEGLYAHTKNNYQICGLNQRAKEALAAAKSEQSITAACGWSKHAPAKNPEDNIHEGKIDYEGAAKDFNEGDL